ncbi:MAG: hypothetical protein JO151_04610 [Verrucomicrobia bacterium]|nr:hypothetical protein [Verrucomicrobiota bacterium]
MVSLTNLFQASLELFRQQEGEPEYLRDIGAELSAVYQAIELELQLLMFFIIVTVGLDAEKPVGVQTVFNSYFGVSRHKNTSSQG